MKLSELKEISVISSIRHNPGMFAALTLCIMLAGCAFFPFKTTSPTDEAKRITRDQLNTEITAFEVSVKGQIDTFYAKAKAADEDLGRKEQFATVGLKSLQTLASATGVQIPEVATGVFALLGTGLFIDNRRKDTKLLLERGGVPTQGGPPPSV